MEILIGIVVIIVLFGLFGKGKSSSGSTQYGKWYKTNEGLYFMLIKLVGVTYDGRQYVIRQLKSGDSIEPRFFVWEGQPALDFLYKGKSIGVLPKEYASNMKKLEKYITQIKVHEVMGGGQYNYGVSVLISLSKEAASLIN